jgi:two-component system, OmpR family, response regulator
LYLLNALNIHSVSIYQMKALIIDDEIDICYLLSGLLSRKKIEVDYVNSIAEAVLAMEKQKPEIVFLDNRLPDGKGIDFAAYIKNKYPAVKVAMITAYDTPADRTIALKQGIDYFVGKPFSKDIIYQTVDEMVN